MLSITLFHCIYNCRLLGMSDRKAIQSVAQVLLNVCDEKALNDVLSAPLSQSQDGASEIKIVL